jgi:transposase
VMEATGRYGEDLAHFLNQQDHVVSVVNPLCIARYADSLLVRNKTDGVDSRLLARYGYKERPRQWIAASADEVNLRDLTRGLHQLKREKARLKTQIGDARHPSVKHALEETVETIKREMLRLESEIRSHIAADDELKRQRKLLVSVIGIGEQTAAVWLGELGRACTERFPNPKKAAAFAGLSVQHHKSGETVQWRPRLSKIGNAHLRKALYYPALVAMRHNPVIRAFCERLKAKGKAPMVVVGAAMRKLLHICFGVLKSGRPFTTELQPAT